jgi:hypothetical protein
MNDLEKYFNQNKANLIHKWRHYFDIYDRHFSGFRNKEIDVLEIGVSHGGSLHMWKHYFGPKARIYGVDINPDCKKLEDEQIRIIIGSQEDRSFLRHLKKTVPAVDILIDDGGHTMTQQIITFEELFDHIDNHGVYLCEDLHTSYWREWGGGYKRNNTFIEYSKNFIDYINAWHSKTKRLVVTEFTKTAYALHFYDSVLVIEKKPVEEPCVLKTGKPVIQAYNPPVSTARTLLGAASRRLKRLTRRRGEGVY